MDLSFLTNEELLAMKNGDYSKISTDNLKKIKAQNVESFDRSDQPISAIENVQETGVSPLSLKQRVKTQFGDKTGNIEMLKKEGLDPVFRDGKLYIRDKQDKTKITPADPSFFSNNIFSSIKDLPSDVAEFTADAPSMLMQTAGEAVGGGAGMLTGNPILAALGKLTGGTLGSIGGEKIRQKVGEKLGNYSGENKGEETLVSGIGGALGTGIPMAFRGGKQLLKKTAEIGLDKMIPERMFASATGLGDELAENPDAVKFLMSQGFKGSTKDLMAKANTFAKLTEDALKQQQAGGTVSIDDVLANLKKYEPDVAAGDIAAYKKALGEVLGELKDNTVFKDTKIKIPYTGSKNPIIPSDDVLQQLYKKQYPNADINLPMAPYKSLKKVELNQPSFEEFKKSVVEAFTEQTPIKTNFGEALTTQMPEGIGMSDDALKKIYQSEYPQYKTISKVHPLPKGKMKAPSFEEWKDRYVSQFMKQNRPQEFETITKKTANAIDANKAKRSLYKSSQNLFGSDSYGVTKKGAQKQVSLAIKDAIENAVKNGDVKELNKQLHAYSILADMLGLKEEKNLAKPLVSGTTKVLGSAMGKGSAATNMLLDAVGKSTTAGTTTAQSLKWLFDHMNELNVDPTVIQKLFGASTGQLIRESDRNQ